MMGTSQYPEWQGEELCGPREASQLRNISLPRLLVEQVVTVRRAWLPRGGRCRRSKRVVWYRTVQRRWPLSQYPIPDVRYSHIRSVKPNSNVRPQTA